MPASKSRLALIPLLLLSKSSPLRWALIWFFFICQMRLHRKYPLRSIYARGNNQSPLALAPCMYAPDFDLVFLYVLKSVFDYDILQL